MDDVQNFNVGKKEKEKWIVCLVLKWKTAAEKPDIDQNIEWRANYHVCKMEQLGPPNQLFLQYRIKVGGKIGANNHLKHLGFRTMMFLLIQKVM